MSAMFKASRFSAHRCPEMRADYLCWLSAPEVFAGMNKYFISAAVEDSLAMAGGSVDLAVLQTSTAGGGYFAWGTRCAENCPRGLAKMVALLWLQFHTFVFQAKLCEVSACAWYVAVQLDDYNPAIFVSYVEEN
jgi:hypothetical protein